MLAVFAVLWTASISGVAHASPAAHRGDGHRADIRAAAGSGGVRMSVTQMSSYLAPRKRLQLAGSLANGTSETLQDVTIHVYYGTGPFPSRGALEEYADGSGANPSNATTAEATIVSARPGASPTWRISQSTASLGLTSFGVYPALIVATNSAGQTLASDRTFFIWEPAGGSGPKVGVSWVWPIVDEPNRSSDTTFTGNDLAGEVAPGGRLDGLVSAGSGADIPLTWMVDPSAVDDAAAMGRTQGYDVDGQHYPADQNATAWLAKLGAATQKDPTALTPYADPDVMGLVADGRTGDLNAATKAGESAFTAVSGMTPTPLTDLALPPDGMANQRTLAALAHDGARTVLLNGGLLPGSSTAVTANPKITHQAGGKRLTLIGYDGAIQQVLASSGSGDAALEEQRFLAETAMFADESPGTAGRTLVVVPPERWDPSPRLAAGLLAATGDVPWLDAVPLSKAARHGARTFDPPRTVTSGRLPRAYLDQVADLAGDIHRFGTALTPRATDYSNTIYRAESSRWRGDLSGGTALLAQANRLLNADIARIKVLEAGLSVTLAGKAGTIPITIANNLTDSTITVRVVAVSHNPARLMIGRYTMTVTISARHEDTVQIPMRSTANGSTAVDVRLYTPNGSLLAPASQVTVRTTGYGLTALIITGSAFAVLCLGIGIRVRRRIRADNGAEKTGV